MEIVLKTETERCLNYIVMHNVLILIVIDPELLLCLNIFNLLNLSLVCEKLHFSIWIIFNINSRPLNSCSECYML